MSDLYDDLGVPKDASNDTIKKAYRKRAQKAHPDKGGSKEEFHQIQLAYEVLSDEDRRKRYDETGRMDNDDPNKIAYESLQSIFLQIVEGADPDTDDLVEMVRKVVVNKTHNINLNIATLRQSIKKLERAKKRVRHKGKGKNILLFAIEAKLATATKSIKSLEMEIEVGNKISEVLREYFYEADPKSPFDRHEDGLLAALRAASMARKGGGPFEPFGS